MIVILSVIFLGCTNQPESTIQESTIQKPDWASSNQWEQWTNCVDVSCRSLVIDEDFKRKDSTTANWVNLIDQPEEQFLQIERLQTKHPGRLKKVCTQLVNQSLRKSCLSSSARPHLYARGNVRSPQDVPKRTAAGPKASLILLPLVPRSHLRSVKPHIDQCANDVDRRSCLQRYALSAVDTGDSLEVSRYCEAISSTHIRWRWECHFKAAEAFLNRDLKNYKVATDHCLVANEYSGRCVTVLNKILAKHSPPSDSNATGWKSSLQMSDQIREAWKPYGDRLTNEIVSSFWGFSLLHSYKMATEITGDPLDHLAEDVIPHIRAAAAYELLSRGAPTTDMTFLVNDLQARLNIRKLSSKSVREVYIPPTIKDLWAEDDANDVDVVAIKYLGRSRRTYSEVEKEDLSICILEAAAQLNDGWLPLLKAHRNSSIESLQWTASRLLKQRR